MTLFTWIMFKITKELTSAIYWTAMLLAALLFALGHLPMVFQLVTEPTMATYVYIITGNCVGGIIFGYAYWKWGLECAFIAHAFAHLVMILLSFL